MNKHHSKVNYLLNSYHFLIKLYAGTNLPENTSAALLLSYWYTVDEFTGYQIVNTNRVATIVRQLQDWLIDIFHILGREVEFPSKPRVLSCQPR